MHFVVLYVGILAHLFFQIACQDCSLVDDDKWTLSSTRAQCYYFAESGETKTFDQAQLKCQELMSSLVSIRSENEWIFLYNRSMQNDYWIGLERRNTVGTAVDGWEWIDNTAYDPTAAKWYQGEPLSGGERNVEPNLSDTCAYLIEGKYWVGSTVITCDAPKRFICMKDPEFEPVNTTGTPEAPPTPPPPTPGNSTRTIIGISVAVVIIIIIAVALLVFFLIRKRNRTPNIVDRPVPLDKKRETWSANGITVTPLDLASDA